MLIVSRNLECIWTMTLVKFIYARKLYFTKQHWL